MVPASARDNNVVELAQTSVQAEQGGHFSFQLRDPPYPTYVGSQSLNTFQGHQINLSVTTKKEEFLSGSESENLYPHCHVREDGDDIDFWTDTENPGLHSPSGDSAVNGFQEYIDKRAEASVPEMIQCTTLQHSTPPQSSYIQQKSANLTAGWSTGDSQDFQLLKRQCLEPPPQLEEDMTNPKGDSAEYQVHHGIYSRNAKGTIPINPMLIAFYPPLWEKLLNLAKAHMLLSDPQTQHVQAGECKSQETQAGLTIVYRGAMYHSSEEEGQQSLKYNEILYLCGEPDGQFAEFQEYVPYRALALVAAMVHVLLSSFRKHGINNSAQFNLQDVDEAYTTLNKMILNVLNHPHHGLKLEAMLTEWAQSGMTGYVMKHKLTVYEE
ncbi:hypothetical protein EDD16DRAFT_1516111 [Pisolithus croceorrhizus]|nr:hypothetical protein EDD16DRAFT_1516111 [Pisolithus croceorrhizus]